MAAVKTNSKAVEAAETQNQEPAKVEQSVQEASQEQQEQETTLVYVGPTLPRGQLKANVIFNGTRTAIEGELAEVLEKFPPVRNLLVPVSNLATAKAKVKTSGNILHEWYTQVVALIEESLKEG